jgi:hypothetical protein
MPRNITNGEFRLDYNQEDRVDEDYKLLKQPANHSIDSLRHDDNNIPINYFIESKFTLN